MAEELGGNANFVPEVQVSVGDTATLMLDAPAPNRRISRICNTDASATVYIGDENVTTANGFPIAPGQTLAITGPRSMALYGIVAASTVDVRIWVETT